MDYTVGFFCSFHGLPDTRPFDVEARDNMIRKSHDHFRRLVEAPKLYILILVYSPMVSLKTYRYPLASVFFFSLCMFD